MRLTIGIFISFILGFIISNIKIYLKNNNLVMNWKNVLIAIGILAFIISMIILLK